MWVGTFTGPRVRQLERLLSVVRERVGIGLQGGRPWCLPLAERVLLVSVHYCTNLTKSTGCSGCGLWIVDGTLIPVRDRKVGASARDYWCSAHVQVIIDADTHL